MDYELGVNPFEAERSKFIDAIGRISQLPNLEMNFKRGDSLHDYICGHPVRLDLDTSDYIGDLEKIEKLGLQLHKAKRAEFKKKLRLEILERRIALGKRVVRDQITRLKDMAHNLSTDLFQEPGMSDREKRERTDREIRRLEEALKQLDRDEKELNRLEARPLDKDFYRHLRELEGAQPDGPANFVWRLDFPHVLASQPASPLQGISGWQTKSKAKPNSSDQNRDRTAASTSLLGIRRSSRPAILRNGNSTANDGREYATRNTCSFALSLN